MNSRRRADLASWLQVRPLFLLLVLSMLCLTWAWAGGTITDSKYIWLQRSGVTLGPNTIPSIPRNPMTVAECLKWMSDGIAKEMSTRTSGYVTWRCLDATQQYVKFSKTTAPVLSQVTISWTPPTQNMDGTPIDNLAGYRVLYGTAPTTLSQATSVPANTTRWVADGLAPGTWYFALKAFKTGGEESPLSTVASKTVP